jgi:hypothetical protein
MKKAILLLLVLLVHLPALYSQDSGRPDHIKSGFYMKLGPSIPVGNFATTQYAVTAPPNPDTLVFSQAKTGPVIDFGYLVYIGPSFANHMLRAGVDAVFFSVGFNKSTHPLEPGDSKYEYWYVFAGQRFGPVFTINPVDYLMLDLSYKLGFTAAEYHSKWGYNYLQNELSLGIRYRILAFSVNYDFGNLNYNDFDNTNPDRVADLNTVRIMIGFKF